MHEISLESDSGGLLSITHLCPQVPGLTCYVSGLVAALTAFDSPGAVLAATEGIGLAAGGAAGDAHVDLLYKSQVLRSPAGAASLPSIMGGVT